MWALALTGEYKQPEGFIGKLVELVMVAALMTVGAGVASVAVRVVRVGWRALIG